MADWLKKRHALKIAREDALTEAIKAADAAIGDHIPHAQALRIIASIRQLRDRDPARVASLSPVDYLRKAQEAARTAWAQTRRETGPQHDASAGIDTPIGRLKAVVWRKSWNGGKRGERVVWAGEYYLDDEPITITEIRAAGLAQRPTNRMRGGINSLTPV